MEKRVRHVSMEKSVTPPRLLRHAQRRSCEKKLRELIILIGVLQRLLLKLADCIIQRMTSSRRLKKAAETEMRSATTSRCRVLLVSVQLLLD